MRIVSTLTLRPPQRALLEEAAPGATIVDRPCRTLDDISKLAAADGGCDVIFTFRVPPGIEQSAPTLKWIQLLSAGVDHALHGRLADSVAITSASGIHAAPIAEYTIASMLSFAHRFHQLMRAQMRREWGRNGDFMASVDVLRGKTIGIVGYGSIGRETARLARAFGMRVLALKRDPAARTDRGWMPPGLGDPDGSIPERFYGPDERIEMLGQSDFISVTLPATAATRAFLGARELAAMRPHAYIVNIGRGDVIDQSALIEALREKRIAGAGLDVFEREPLEPESALWEMENAILSPHMSGAFKGYVEAACGLFAENLRRFANGRPLFNRVDPALGY